MHVNKNNSCHFTVLYNNKHSLQNTFTKQISNSNLKTEQMKNEEVNSVLLALIAYLREIADIIEAAQTKLQEGFTMEDSSHTTISTHADHPNSKILKNILQDATVEDQSMEDNISFMLGSIHKRIGKYKRTMKDSDTL